ncbi:MAG: protein-disulfide reductase DsbD domain-containing protein, partial [Planctomycetota bacterium]|nr:protein-disulfide reductase DsbD domain-containing protein [Planctomycetota bacterium]
EPDWHVYWKNPGVSGAATEIEVFAPEGFKVGEPVFPRPTIIQTTDGPTYGYGDLAAIFIPVTAPDLIKEEPVTFKILTMWLACKKTCVLGESETDLTLAMNSETRGPLHKDLRLSKWQKRLPKELNLLKEGSCRIVESDLMISGVVGDQAVTFIGVERRGVRFKGQISTTSTEGKFTLTVPLVLEYSPIIPEAIEVEGLLLLGSNPDGDSYVIRATAEP